MKKIVITAISLMCFISTLAYSQSDFSVDLGVAGVTVGGLSLTEIRLDLDVGTRFISAHGVALDELGLSVPATGTCFVTASNGIFCNIQVDQNSYTLDLGPTLVGNIFLKNEFGVIAETGTVFIINVL